MPRTHRLPEILDHMRADGSKVDHARVALGAIADDVGLGRKQVEAECHVAHRRLRPTSHAQLQQPVTGPRKHGEGARTDLSVEVALIARRHAVKGPRTIGHRADENINAPRRTFRIGSSRQILRQLQLLLQRHEIDASRLQHCPTGQVQRMHHQAVVQPVSYQLLARQETRTQAIRHLAQPQVERRRLYLI